MVWWIQDCQKKGATALSSLSNMCALHWPAETSRTGLQTVLEGFMLRTLMLQQKCSQMYQVGFVHGMFSSLHWKHKGCGSWSCLAQRSSYHRRLSICSEAALCDGRGEVRQTQGGSASSDCLSSTKGDPSTRTVLLSSGVSASLAFLSAVGQKSVVLQNKICSLFSYMKET